MAVAAVVATGVGLSAMSGAASGATCIHIFFVCTKDVSLGIRNSSKAAITVESCGPRHASNPSNVGDRVCSAITTPLPIYVKPGHRLILPNDNPIGIIIKGIHQYPGDPSKPRTLDFYVKNPDIGLPFVRWPGSRELDLPVGIPRIRYVDGVQVEFRRYADEDRDGQHVKLIKIEILKWPGTVP
jgi:hypothetical protein